MNRLIKKKNKIVSFVQDFLKNKNSLYVIFASLILLCFITYLVPIEFDFTRNKANSISSQGKKIVKNLDVKDGELEVKYFSAIVDSNIDSFVYDRVKTVFNQFHKYNKKIRFEIIDLNNNPDALVMYQTAETKCILITYKGKNITIPFDKLVYTYDNVLEVDVEERLLEEFLKLKTESKYNIYYTKGHGEKINEEEFSEFRKLVNNLGYNFVEVNLNNYIPDDANNLILFAPQIDFTIEEIVRLDDYVSNGNNLFVVLSGMLGKDVNGNYDYCPNLVNFYHSIGINVSDKIVVDQIQDTKLIGVYTEEDNDTIKVEDLNSIVYLPNSRLITISPFNDTYDITQTMISGELNSYPLVVKLHDDNNKILFVASSDMFNDNYLNHNKPFITYLLEWIDYNKPNINIEPFFYKEYTADPNEFKSALVLGIIEIMIPLMFLYAGFEYTRKRKANTKSKIMK